MIKPIQILSDVITTTAHTVNISGIVDNGDGTYTLTVDNTYYLHAKTKITINSILYTIDSFVLNTTLILSGVSVPTVDSFVLDAPLVVHGTPQKVNGEWQLRNTKEYPIIWILEFLKASYDDKFTSAINATLDLNIFFLTDINYEDFDISQHQTNAIDPMANEIDFIIKVIKKRRDLFGEIEGHVVTNHINFGEYITNKGYDKQILTDQVSGCQLELSLPYVVDVCGNSSAIVSICNPVSIYENAVFKEYVQAGGSFYYTTGSCADGVVTTKDSAGNVLYNTSVASGGAVDQTIVDGVNTLNGGAVSGILAEGVKSITLKDTLGVTVAPTVLVDSLTNLDLEIPVSATGLNSSELTKSGATVSFQSKDDGDLEQGSGVDFLTLSYNNKFGTTDRFTDDLGTQIYASDVVVDWSTFNQVDDTVLAYKKTVIPQATLATHLAGQPYTNGGFSGWYLCNIKQLINIANLGIYRNVLNYPPFNYTYVTSGNRIWSSTMEASTTAYMLNNTSLGIVASITQNYRTFLCRIYTLTELGL